MSAKISFQTTGTCSRLINIEISEGEIVNIEFIGGCNGNLKGISSLVRGMDIDDVISKLSGITCSDKPTSCPDQLAKCLVQYRDSLLVKN